MYTTGFKINNTICYTGDMSIECKKTGSLKWVRPIRNLSEGKETKENLESDGTTSSNSELRNGLQSTQFL
jgi:hypothetical protein